MQNFFYATEADEHAVWGVALAIPGLRVFERTTEELRELREFASPEEIAAAQATFPPYLELCLFPSTPGVSPEIDVDYDDFGCVLSQTVCRPLTIGFRRYAPVNDCLNHCNFYAWNGPGAGDENPSPREISAAVDWKKRASLFRKLKREIEKAAPAKVGRLPILPDAFDKLKAGDFSLWWAGQAVSISSPHITVKTG